MAQTITGAMTILRLKWDCAWHIIERAVARGKTRKEPSPLPRIGIDEKAIAKVHSYVSMIYDLDNSTVDAIHEGCDTDAALACFSRLSEDQIKSIEAIAMELSSAYVKAANQVVPLAEEKIVHDPFHVMKMANEALDKVRKQEHRKLLREGDATLSGSIYLWLTGMENHTENQTASFASICSLRLATGKAWSYKELLRDLWKQPDAKRATCFFNDW